MAGLARPFAPALAAAFLGCIFFGLTSLFLVQGAGDGGWYFYATAFLNGSRLYSDMHLVLQPMFVLINAMGISIFGHSYYGQKMIFIFVLFGYVGLGCILVGKSSWPPSKKALLLLASFFVGIHFSAYRFDDYHAFENLVVMAIVLLSFRYLDNQYSNTLRISSSIGILLGAAILTRVNDGLMLLIAATAIYFIRGRAAWFRDALALAASAAGFVCLTLFLIGDTPTAWLRSTLLDAAAAKGGSGKLILTPLELTTDCFLSFFIESGSRLWLLLGCLLLISVGISQLERHDALRIRSKALPLGAFFVACLVPIFWDVDLIARLSAAGFIAGLVFVGTRIRRWRHDRTAKNIEATYADKELLVLFPLALYVSGSMSSGGHCHGIYFPFSLLLLVGAISFEITTLGRITELLILTILLEFSIFGLTSRILDPYSWHSFESAPLYESRFITKKDTLGYFLMDQKLAAFVDPICEAIRAPDSSLLSLPFSYANYICGIPVWGGYVQTFFDTTSANQIKKLLTDIERQPPHFILYQRQLENMRRHELLFNNGNPLPHRRLDQFLISKIEQKEWRVVYSADLNTAEPSTWLLIDTRKP